MRTSKISKKETEEIEAIVAKHLGEDNAVKVASLYIQGANAFIEQNVKVYK